MAEHSTSLSSYSSEGQKSKVSLQVLKSRCQQAWFFLEPPKENMVPLPLLEAASIPWLLAASLQYLLPWSQRLLLLCGQIPLL